MKNKYILLSAAVVAGALTAIIIMITLWPTKDTGIAPDEPKQVLTHEQEVWLGALEWCESRGNPKAINKVDRDGTPSYGAYQFKPSTLWYYADKYGVPTDKTDHMLYGLQRAVVEQMVLHRDQIEWNKQFPDCVRKLGYPPKGILTLTNP